jgi:hypothetical protein
VGCSYIHAYAADARHHRGGRRYGYGLNGGQRSRFQLLDFPTLLQLLFVIVSVLVAATLAARAKIAAFPTAKNSEQVLPT